MWDGYIKEKNGLSKHESRQKLTPSERVWPKRLYQYNRKKEVKEESINEN